MPIMIIRAPTSRAFSSAWFRLRANLRLELLEAALEQLPRRDVDLQVELAELGDEVRVGDRVEHRSVLQRRLEIVVDEIELDLQADLRVLEVELAVGQHPREHVEAPAHLFAVLLPVLACEDLERDVFAHRGLRWPASDQRGPAHRR